MRFGNIIALCLFSFTLQAAAQSGNPARIIRRVDETLQRAGKVRIDFKETFVWSMSDHSQTVEGRLWLMGDRFRIETDEQDIISDGESIWTVNKLSKRVLIDRIDPSDDNLLPRRILFTYSDKYNVRLAGDERILDRNCHKLVFTAPDRNVLYPEAVVWVERDTWIIRRVEQIDLNGDKLIYTMTDVELAVDIPDSFFKYNPPPEFDVVDLR